MYPQTSIYMTALLLTSNYICKANDIFKPTKEWKIVEKGQKIPQGLHVRINFETGITEAKLLDKTEDTAKNQEIIKVESDQNQLDPQELKKIKDKYRNKPAINPRKAKTLSEIELLMENVVKLKEELNREKLDPIRVASIFEDVEFLAHLFENSVEFVRLDGFREIIYPTLNNTDNTIRRHALRLFSSLVQNNPQTKRHAYETGAVPVLVRLLNFSTDKLAHSTLIALGSLLRQNMPALDSFIENGGLQVLAKQFNQHDLKLRVKCTVLLGDLIEETPNLIDRIPEMSEWCERFNELFHILLMDDPDNFESIENCLRTMNIVADTCWTKYDKNMLENVCKKLNLIENFSESMKYCEDFSIRMNE